MVSKRVEHILAMINQKESELLSLCEQYYDLNIRELFTGEISNKINDLMLEMDMLTKNLLNYENARTSNT
jgi:hypothetical protein